MSITRLLVGLVGCLLLSLVGQALGCIALDGVVTLAVLGSLIFGSGGWTWGLLVAVIGVVRLGLTWRGRFNDKAPQKLVDRDRHLGTTHADCCDVWC